MKKRGPHVLYDLNDLLLSLQGSKAELTWVTCYISRWFTRPQAVTHPSTNRAQCRLTTVIEANALTTTLRRHLKKHLFRAVNRLQIPLVE